MFDKIFFLISALATVIGAICVVANKRLIHSCIYLLLTLFGVAGLYATLGADFLAATQLVVYAGGVVILMLFAVMLTGGHEDNKGSRFGIENIPAMGSMKTYVIGFITATIIGSVVYKLLKDVVSSHRQTELEGYAPTVEKIGMSLATDHVLAFEISSILLLGALVGAAIIARPKRS